MFYRGKHAAKSTRSFKMNKVTVMVVSLVLLFTFVIGGTMAWLADDTGPVVNVFEPAEVTCEVIEPGWTNNSSQNKTNVTIKNTGNIDAYIRAAIIVNWRDANGMLIPADSGEYTLKIAQGAGWTEVDGIYYHDPAVASGAETGVLISECYPNQEKAGYQLQVEIVADAVQSTLGSSAQVAFNAAAQG